jgi:hypothetical protein
MCRLSPLLAVASSLVALRPLSVPAIVPFGRITPMYVTVVLTCTPYSMPTPRSVTSMRGSWPSSGSILVPMVYPPESHRCFRPISRRPPYCPDWLFQG